MTSPPQPRRWWRVRISLGGLMVLVLLIGLPLGWKARRASIQRRAVAEVEARGGGIFYEDQIDRAGMPTLPHRPGGPAWLRRLVGDAFFQEVAWVEFDAGPEKKRVDDESLAAVSHFGRLQGLVIAGPVVGDDQPSTRLITEAGLSRLTGLTRLRRLHLIRVGTTAAMLDLLPRWPALTDVNIHDPLKTLPGSSLRPLGQLADLEYLVVGSVASCQAADLAPLQALKKLRWLSITHSSPGDFGVGQLGSLATLQLLVLPNTELRGGALTALNRAPKLMALSLDGSGLAPGELSAMAGLARLSYLEVALDGQGGRSSTPYLVHPPSRRRFGDADLDALRHVPLRNLSMMGLDATDAGVGRLLASHSFQFLTLSGRGITDASADALAAQGQLQRLILADSGITTAGLTQLAACPALEALGLIDNAQLTDASLSALATYPRLDDLIIRQAGLQPATLDALRAARVEFGTLSIQQAPDEAAR